MEEVILKYRVDYELGGALLHPRVGRTGRVLERRRERAGGREGRRAGGREGRREGGQEGGRAAGLHKTSILCILDTRQIDPDKTASIQKNNKTSWAEGPARIK